VCLHACMHAFCRLAGLFGAPGTRACRLLPPPNTHSAHPVSPLLNPNNRPSLTHSHTHQQTNDDRHLLASVLELDAQFPPSTQDDDDDEEEEEEEAGTTCLGIISVERRNADGVDDFLALARETMEVAEVQRDEQRGWFIYELRRRKGKRVA
jgi:hypothetical protein